MADYVSNTPISRPLKVPGLTPDRDFNGLMWSHQHGFIYYPLDDFLPIRKPPNR